MEALIDNPSSDRWIGSAYKFRLWPRSDSRTAALSFIVLREDRGSAVTLNTSIPV
jgi:hypothetical protein